MTEAHEAAVPQREYKGRSVDEISPLSFSGWLTIFVFEPCDLEQPHREGLG